MEGSLRQRRDVASKDFAGKTNFDASFGWMKQDADFNLPDLAAALTRVVEGGAGTALAASLVHPHPYVTNVPLEFVVGWNNVEL
jgi:hypothetical protein